MAQISTDHVEELRKQVIPDELRNELAKQGIDISPVAIVYDSYLDGRWVLWDRHGQDRFALIFGGDAIAVRSWGDWYDYPGSYWKRRERPGVDQGEASRTAYAFHTLIGHHGVLSLTPIWLLSLFGVFAVFQNQYRGLRGVALIAIMLTAACLFFYIARPELDRNYGGVSCGFRWLFWLIPIWLICLIPAADIFGRTRTGRVVALLCLLASVVSAHYAALNPWSHP